MKKVNFLSMLTAVALMTGVTSCSNDDKLDDGGVIGKGEKATLNVSVTAPDMSRAVGAAVPSDAVGDFSVFITDQTDQIVWSTYSSTGAGITNFSVTTSAKNVYVVANAGDLTSSITTMAQLNAYKADLNGTGSQAAATNRWATGVTASPLSFTQTGNNFTANTTVTLTFIAARITVTVDNQMTNYGDPGSLALDGIVVLNARGESLLFPAAGGGTSLIPATYTANKKFYEGMANPVSPATPFANYPAAGEFTVAASLLSDALTTTATDKYYYYVFENDALTDVTLPTIVTLTGTDANGDALYWPVHLAAYEQWANSTAFTTTGIQRGHSYDIKITLKGDATNGGGGGTDPTKPLVTASVDVSVTLTPWTPVLLEKEF